MNADLRNEIVPLLQSHAWDESQAFVERHATNPEAKALIVLARGVREAIEGDMNTGLLLLAESVDLGCDDARLQRALLRALADQEWDLVIDDVSALRKVQLPFDDQRSLYDLLLEKVGEDLQSRREFAQALGWWNELLERVPDTPIGYQRRSRCHLRLGALELALKDANRHLELEPQNRLAWLGRANIKKALGDVAGAEADEKAGEPFYDVQVSDEVREQARELLAGDRDENLNTRLGFFEQVGLHDLDIAIEVLEQEWVFTFLPGEEGALDLSFTVGLFYRFGHAELMFHSRDLDLYKMKNDVSELVERIRDGHVVKAGDTIELQDKRVHFEVPTRDDLAKYPYGYGGHFYRHFMDRPAVPLLLARFT